MRKGSYFSLASIFTCGEVTREIGALVCVLPSRALSSVTLSCFCHLSWLLLRFLNGKPETLVAALWLHLPRPRGPRPPAGWGRLAEASAPRAPSPCAQPLHTPRPPSGPPSASCLCRGRRTCPSLPPHAPTVSFLPLPPRGWGSPCDPPAREEARRPSLASQQASRRLRAVFCIYFSAEFLKETER